MTRANTRFESSSAKVTTNINEIQKKKFKMKFIKIEGAEEEKISEIDWGRVRKTGQRLISYLAAT